ncbi:MAG: hypothetical protein GXP08_10875 [Gammaproteobacteria bacterium]|nr:hypothetical protein [Gammaproteobacteria bacterium]
MVWRKAIAVWMMLIPILAGLNGCGGDGGGQNNTTSVAFVENGKLAVPVNFRVLAGNKKAVVYWQVSENSSSYNLYWHTTPGVNKSNGNRLLGVNPGYVHTARTNGETYYYILTTVVDNGESLPSMEQHITPQAVAIAGLFDDANLQHCVDAWAAQQGWVFADDIVEVLDCSFRGIVSLAGAEKLINMQHLNVSNNAVVDISPLSALPALQSIDLSYNKIGLLDSTLIFEIEGLKGLTALSLQGNSQLDCVQLGRLIDTVGRDVLDIATPQQGINCRLYNNTQPPIRSEPIDDDTAGNDGAGGDTGGDSASGGEDAVPGNNNGPANTRPAHVIAVPGNNQITLYWDTVADATEYTLYWSTAQPINRKVATKVENVLPGYVQTQLVNQTRYSFVLTATVAGSESPASEEVSAVPADEGTLLDRLFTDNALQECIDQLAAAKGWRYAHELVGNVDCSSRAIQQLAGVEHLTTIDSLNVLNNQIADISALAALINLKRLYLNDNQIDAVNSLSGLVALEFLNLRNNQLTDISAISNLTTLTVLYMNNNAIVDASPIAMLTALQSLDLRDNALGGENVGNIDSLVTLTNAGSIRLLGNEGLACVEVISLIDALGERVVDLSAVLDRINCALPPQTPIAFVANTGNQRILLSWDKTPRADRYHIYWSESPNIDITSREPIPVTSTYYVHNNLTNDIAYYYVITAVNAAGESPASAPISATPSLILIADLFADANLQACVDALAQLNVWTTTDQITGVLNCSAQGIAVLEGMEHLTSVTELVLNQNILTNIDALATLTQLKLLSLSGNSLVNIDAISGLTTLAALNLSNNRLQNIQPLSILTALKTVNLSNNNIGEQGIGDVDDLVTLVNASDIQLVGNVNIACSDLVILLGVLGDGVVDLNEPQDAVNCTASSIIPSGVRAVSGNNQISVQWNVVDTALDYRIYWATTPGVDVNSAESAVTATSRYLHTGLVNDTTYYYIVTARRNTGEGTPSEEVASVPSANGVAIQGLIPDAALRSCVASVANRSGWKFAHEITGAINCSSKNVVDLSGLEYLTALQRLRLGSNRITDLTALSGLSSIVFLDLFNNNIINISGLAGLNTLTTLYLHANNISDISALSGLVSLQYLILDENSIRDVTPLSSVTSLQRIFLRKNKINNVNTLATLTQATHLYLNDNLITDISPLANLVLLQQLDVRSNNIGGLDVGNLDSLAPLMNISRIYVIGNSDVSCVELNRLATVLGPSVIDVGAANDGVNCVNP